MAIIQAISTLNSVLSLIGHLSLIIHSNLLPELDYIVYTPRTDNGTRYGAFNEFNVYVMTNGSSEWTKVAECARGDKNYTPTTIQLEQSYTDVKQVRFEIRVSPQQPNQLCRNGFLPDKSKQI